jgi:hypothetical protein
MFGRARASVAASRFSTSVASVVGGSSRLSVVGVAQTTPPDGAAR